jgi:hypothetical protein
MTDTILTTDMPWVRYLNWRMRRGIQYVLLLYFLQFLLPSYIYGMYRYSEDEMAFSDYFQSISPWFEFFALFPGVFVVLAARFVAVPFAFALVALVWVGWDSLPDGEKRFSALTSLITIVVIPLTTPLFDGFGRWLSAMD